MARRSRTVATAAHALAFELTLTDGSEYPHAGSFLFANRQVDSLTGTLRIATSFPNPTRLLSARASSPAFAPRRRIEHNALLVPQRAVTELQGTYQVMVLKPDSTVTIQPVTSVRGRFALGDHARAPTQPTRGGGRHAKGAAGRQGRRARAVRVRVRTGY